MYRYLIGPAKYFFFICNSFEKNANLKLEDIVNNHHFKSVLLKFEDSFYKKRSILKSKLNTWCSLHSVYKEFNDFLKSSNDNFVIITNKDKSSVKQLAAHFSFDNRIIEVFSKEDSLDKCVLMNKIKIKYSSYSSFIFVDDNRENIAQLKSIKNVKCYQPLWGYNNQHSKKEDFQISSFSDILL
tara:strand:+ start:3468 stop:4019 length:552 start_codon:yes stop_codon:yes gene_type:complete